MQMVLRLSIAFIGAGQVNFGGGEGPWDHATRLETIALEKLPKRDPEGAAEGEFETQLELHFAAIVDLDVGRAEGARKARQERGIDSNDERSELWRGCQVFSSVEALLAACESGDCAAIDCAFIGVPPRFHGHPSEPGKNPEVLLLSAGIHVFVEKPLSCLPLETVQACGDTVAQLTKSRGLVAAVGYMFRYSRAIERMRETIRDNGPVRVFSARYNAAYSTIVKEEWWTVAGSGGPILEQSTHFCDLARYLCGEVDLDTVQARALLAYDGTTSRAGSDGGEGPAGSLSAMPESARRIYAHSDFAEEQRIPVVTTAQWQFRSGALGSYVHATLLHDVKYETELEVWGDGYSATLRDPYGICELSVRLSGQEEMHVECFQDDDTYLSEDQAFIQAVIAAKRGSPVEPHLIRSPYGDSLQTYAFTWKIHERATTT
jgi:predicted dehydrogenase